MRTLRQLGNRKKKVTIWVHVDRYGRTHHPFMRQVEKLDYEVDLIELATIGGQPVKYCMGVTLDIKFGAADNTPEAAPPDPVTDNELQDFWNQTTWQKCFFGIPE